MWTIPLDGFTLCENGGGGIPVIQWDAVCKLNDAGISSNIFPHLAPSLIKNMFFQVIFHNIQISKEELENVLSLKMSFTEAASILSISRPTL